MAKPGNLQLFAGIILIAFLYGCSQSAILQPTSSATRLATSPIAESEAPKPSDTPEATMTSTPFEAVVNEDRGGCVVSAPPSGYGDWFAKYCDAGGIPVLASKNVSDIAVQQAYYVVMNFFAAIPEHKEKLVAAGVQFILYDLDHETIADIPSTRLFNFTEEAAGVFISENYQTISFENDLLCYYGLDSSVAIHELAHALDFASLQYSQDWLQARNVAFGKAKNHNLWTGTYAMTNNYEFWAEVVSAYFGVYSDPYGKLGAMDRQEFAAYDPVTFALVSEIFHGFEWRPTCP